jgi:DNA-directed RNA polymerase subunit beta
MRGADAPDNETARGIIDKLFFSDKRYDLGRSGRYKINRKLSVTTDLNTKVLTREDIIEIIKISRENLLTVRTRSTTSTT